MKTFDLSFPCDLTLLSLFSVLPQFSARSVLPQFRALNRCDQNSPSTVEFANSPRRNANSSRIDVSVCSAFAYGRETRYLYLPNVVCVHITFADILFPVTLVIHAGRNNIKARRKIFRYSCRKIWWKVPWKRGQPLRPNCRAQANFSGESNPPPRSVVAISPSSFFWTPHFVLRPHDGGECLTCEIWST